MYQDDEVEYDEEKSKNAAVWSRADILEYAMSKPPTTPVEMSSVDDCLYCRMAWDKLAHLIPAGASLVGDYGDVSYKDIGTDKYVLLAAFPTELTDFLMHWGISATTYLLISDVLKEQIEANNALEANKE